LLAAGRPVVLALDDMHWADEASLELLAHLLRRRPRAPVLLALAFRDRQAPPRLARPDLAAGEGDVERIELGPLDLAEAEELLAAVVDPESCHEQVLESAGGPELPLVERAPPSSWPRATRPTRPKLPWERSRPLSAPGCRSRRRAPERSPDGRSLRRAIASAPSRSWSGPERSSTPSGPSATATARRRSCAAWAGG
jgi:hypothetical protein